MAGPEEKVKTGRRNQRNHQTKTYVYYILWPVAYSGFRKGGPNFRWPLVLIQRRGQPSFPILFNVKKNYWPKQAMSPPPKYASDCDESIYFITHLNFKRPLLTSIHRTRQNQLCKVYVFSSRVYPTMEPPSSSCNKFCRCQTVQNLAKLNLSKFLTLPTLIQTWPTRNLKTNHAVEGIIIL